LDAVTATKNNGALRAALHVGLIIPSSNRMVEQEMAPAFPEGVRANVTRLRMTGANKAPLDELLPRIEEATRALADAKCDVIAFHCTANSMQEGKRGEERILQAMMRNGAARASTTATAVWRALNALHARRIVLVTPYDQATNDHEIEFLKQAGIDVIHSVACALGASDKYCAAPPLFWKERVLEVERRDADAYFLSCANISTFSVIEELEAQLGRPVVTSNQVVIWDALGRLGWTSRSGLRGRLFATSASLAPARAGQRG
jgi:maleate isomerase